jgi:TatD DNase family protein
MPEIVYKYLDSLYINLTNRCTMACTYCIKHKWAGKFRGSNLRLDREPTAQEVIEKIGDPKQYHEIIFCGYGEPLLRLDELKETAAWVKAHGGRVRINTAGHANLVYKRNIAPELQGLVDAISISMNGSNAEQYVALNRPTYGKEAFTAAIDFARECKKYIPQVTLTAVTLPGIDVEKVRHIAEEAGVTFRARPYLDEYEDQ